jgi:uncharacterized protein YodC (DUF2158 family)
MKDDPNKFAVGDTVRIANIVGPRMVVSKIVQSNGGVLVRCFWFNRRNEFQGFDFGPSFLAKASPWLEHKPTPDQPDFSEVDGAEAAE